MKKFGLTFTQKFPRYTITRPLTWWLALAWLIGWGDIPMLLSITVMDKRGSTVTTPLNGRLFRRYVWLSLGLDSYQPYFTAMEIMVRAVLFGLSPQRSPICG